MVSSNFLYFDPFLLLLLDLAAKDCLKFKINIDEIVTSIQLIVDTPQTFIQTKEENRVQSEIDATTFSLNETNCTSVS